MATSPVSPASKAPFTREPFSRAPESVAPLSRFPGTGSGKTSSRKPVAPLEAVGKQLRWAGALLLVLLVAAAALVYTGQQQAEQSLAQQSAIADMRLMSQGIGRAAVLAVAGQAPGFAQLREAKDSFPQQLGSLGEADERFQGVINAWTQVAKDISTLQNQEKPLIAMGRVASVFDGQAAPLVDLSEQLLMMQKKTGGHPREIEATAQMVGLAGRITRNAGKSFQERNQ